MSIAHVIAAKCHTAQRHIKLPEGMDGRCSQSGCPGSDHDQRQANSLAVITCTERQDNKCPFVTINYPHRQLFDIRS